MQTTYRPGPWYLVVVPGTLVAVSSEVSSDVVTRLWDRVAERATLASVVDVLAAGVKGDLGSVPSFVAVVTEGSHVRIAVRGDVSASVDTASGPQHLSGVDLTTWSERLVPDASRVEVTLAEAEADAEAEDSLPVRDGVVRASSAIADFAAGRSTPVQEESMPVIERSVLAAPEPAASVHEPEPIVPDLVTSVEDPQPVVSEQPEAVPSVEEAEPVASAEEAEPAPEQSEPVGGDVTIIPSEVTLAPSTEDFDQLWGATIHSAPSAPASQSSQTDVFDGDHDGATISVAELRAQRLQASASVDTPTTGAAALGRVKVSTGQVVTLDRTVIIGRRPRSTRASGANLPHLIAVDSPQQDISRSHLEIRPEGDTVVVIDLHTTNGSTLLRAGSDPVRLHPGEQTIVLSGDVIDLGDGVEVVFEDLP